MAADEVRRLVRRTDSKVIAGVAGGLGDYFNVDPVWFRLGFVLATFLGGAGILAYGVLWVLMPKSGSTATSMQRRAENLAASFRGTPSWLGVALVGIGGALVLTQFAHWNAGVFWALALIVLGIALFNRHEAPATPAPLAEAPAVADPTDPTPTVPTEPIAIEQPSLRARRERSGLGLLTIGATMLIVGTAALFDVENVVHITLVQYLGLALAVLGTGLLVGAFIGRARWLFAPALILTPFMLVASLVHVPFHGGSGDVRYRPASVAQVQPVYRQTAGRMVIDLRSLKPMGPLSIVATDVAGRIVVYVPANTSVHVRGRVGGGEVKLFGRTYDGFNVDVRRSFDSAVKGVPVINLDLETSLGQVEVR
jgi:phage shock protein PspC (stress-responsive transcriptional regulator)